MITKKAISITQMPDAQLARLLENRYASLLESERDNVGERLKDLDPAITEAIRRLTHGPMNDRALELVRDIANVTGSHDDHQRRADHILTTAGFTRSTKSGRWKGKL